MEMNVIYSTNTLVISSFLWAKRSAGKHNQQLTHCVSDRKIYYSSKTATINSSGIRNIEKQYDFSPQIASWPHFFIHDPTKGCWKVSSRNHFTCSQGRI